MNIAALPDQRPTTAAAGLRRGARDLQRTAPADLYEDANSLQLTELVDARPLCFIDAEALNVLVGLCTSTRPRW